MTFVPQRTRSRRRLDPGQGPLPVIFQPVSVAKSGTFSIDITYPIPIVLKGIPQILDVTEQPPVAAVLLSPSVLRLTYDEITEAGTQFLVPDWTPAVRGMNGEWASGGPFVAGGNGPGAMPDMTSVASIVSLGGTLVEMTTWDEWSPGSGTVLWIIVGSTVFDSQPSPTTTRWNRSGGASPGQIWRIGSPTDGGLWWGQPLFDVSRNLWLAAGQGILS